LAKKIQNTSRFWAARETYHGHHIGRKLTEVKDLFAVRAAQKIVDWSGIWTTKILIATRRHGAEP